MLRIVKINKKEEWDGFVFEHGHPLQMWGWGELKSSGNWRVERIFVKNENPTARKKKEKYSDVVAAAQILVRKLPWPLRSFAYIPRGAVILSKKPQERAKILELIANYTKKNIKPRSVALSIEPDWESDEFSGDELIKKGWKKAKNTVLLPRTLILDLTKNEEELLAEMTKNNRQIIRKSSEKATVRPIETDEEFDAVLNLYDETAKRAGFPIHGREYYHKLRKLMGENAPIYGAFVKNEILRELFPERINEFEEEQGEKLVGFSWIATSKKTAFELYGGSDDLGRDTRANYILKWLVLIQMKNRGIERYDMNGLLGDGVSKFKMKFARHENMMTGAFDKPFSRHYWIWNNGLPTFKKIVRKFKK